MLDFLKPKTKMRPEELGIALATVLVSQGLEGITKHSQEYGKQVSNITERELNDLWLLFLILHCTVISVGIEASNLGDADTRIILDAFWNSVPDLLQEHRLGKESVAFQANTAPWYEELREPVVEPTSAFSPGSLGPGKTLFKLAMPNRNARENLYLTTELTSYFASTVVAMSEFSTDSVKRTKLLPTKISHG